MRKLIDVKPETWARVRYQAALQDKKLRVVFDEILDYALKEWEKKWGRPQ